MRDSKLLLLFHWPLVRRCEITFFYYFPLLLFSYGPKGTGNENKPNSIAFLKLYLFLPPVSLSGPKTLMAPTFGHDHPAMHCLKVLHNVHGNAQEVLDNAVLENASGHLDQDLLILQCFFFRQMSTAQKQ